MAISISAPASAQKTYTPNQLQSMIEKGIYPKQGSPSTHTQKIDYVACIAKIEATIASVRPNYPARTIASTNVMRTEKIWINDAAITLTCSAPDKKFIITTAPYL